MALAGSACLAADAGVLRLEVEQPRSYGYQIGDKFERIVHLTLADPNRLDPDSLPTRSRISPSLAVDTPRVDEHREPGAMNYTITLTYQLINVDPEVSDIPVPHHDIEYVNGAEKSRILIPAARIGVAVLRGRTGGPDMQGDQAPALLPVAPGRMVTFGIVFALSLIGLVGLRWGLPFAAGNAPFGRAHRKLKALGGARWDDERYAAALQLIHEGFDATAGRTVFPEHLDAFFSAHESFVPVREAVVEFYMRSRAHFFGTAAGDETTRYSYQDLNRLLVQLRNIERGLA